MLRRIIDGKISFISLVPKGANGMPVIFKDQDVFQLNSTIAKYDAVEGKLTALVYVPEHPDLQGEVADAATIEKMAHGFLKDGQGIDIRHDFKAVEKDAASVVESFIVQKGDPRFVDLTDVKGDPVDPTGAWGVVIKIDDPKLKALYASGEWQGVSMGGVATREIETRKESEMALTKEDVAAIVKASHDEIRTAVEEQMAELTELVKSVKAPEAPAVKNEDQASKGFDGDPTDLKAVEKHLKQLKVEQLRKSIDFSDVEQVEALRKQLAEATKPAPSNQPGSTEPVTKADEFAATVKAGLACVGIVQK